MSNITTGFPTLNTTYYVNESNLPSMSTNSTFVNEYIAYVDDDININYTITPNTIYAPIYNQHTGFTGTHGPYIQSGPSGYNLLLNYNINTYFGNSGTFPSFMVLGATGHNFLNNNINGPYCNDTIIKNIKHVGSRNVSINSTDIITYEEINDGDILIDFNRDSNKTEYDYNVFYKESTLIEILKTKKNQFTMKDIDISSIVKYSAKIN
jgi:hypothetical protein